jgi:ATP-binding cassette, subfamily F, member 3
MLDEPTNHLDLEAIEWLEGFLKSWNHAFIVVSHDRYFLDKVTTRTLDLAFGKLEDYPASYNRYLKLREERMARRAKEYEEQQEFIARTEEFIRKYKAGQRTREARGRETRLARLERIERPTGAPAAEPAHASRPALGTHRTDRQAAHSRLLRWSEPDRPGHSGAKPAN